jgi:hypothetical protein
VGVASLVYICAEVPRKFSRSTKRFIGAEMSTAAALVSLFHVSSGNIVVTNLSILPGSSSAFFLWQP